MRQMRDGSRSRRRPATARAAAAVVSILGALVLTAAFASPVDGSDLTVGTTYIWAEPGSHIELGRAPLGGTEGQVCTWSATATSSNQHSVHPGNDIVVRSGDTSIVLAGVEDVAGGSVSGTATGALGADLVATLVMGPDGVFSGGVTVTATVVSCATPTTEPTTTETTEEPTTTTTTETTSTETTDSQPSVAPSGPTTAAPTSQTVVVAPTTPPTTPLTELPVTGPGATSALAAVGTALLAAGFMLTRYANNLELA
ncbi:MAG: hypothetical protein ACRBI6_10995 [Acidimicrobiales bacterium]